MEKKTFEIPVEWAVFATVEIEAESVEEAIKIFNETQDEIPLPTDNEYIDGSFKMSEQGSDEDDIEYVKFINGLENKFFAEIKLE